LSISRMEDRVRNNSGSLLAGISEVGRAIRRPRPGLPGVFGSRFHLRYSTHRHHRQDPFVSFVWAMADSLAHFRKRQWGLGAFFDRPSTTLLPGQKFHALYQD
jgi:hypothetical protein